MGPSRVDTRFIHSRFLPFLFRYAFVPLSLTCTDSAVQLSAGHSAGRLGAGQHTVQRHSTRRLALSCCARALARMLTSRVVPYTPRSPPRAALRALALELSSCARSCALDDALNYALDGALASQLARLASPGLGSQGDLCAACRRIMSAQSECIERSRAKSERMSERMSERTRHERAHERAYEQAHERVSIGERTERAPRSSAPSDLCTHGTR